MTTREPIFPLVSSRRGTGLELAGRTSAKRGPGSEIASSRQYRRGDSMRLIDWRASARLSSARSSDEFVVRDHFAEDALRVVVLVDRSPSMSLFPAGLPWLSKPAVVRAAARLILASAFAVQANMGYVEAGPRGVSRRPPESKLSDRQAIESQLDQLRFDGPSDSLERSLEALASASRDAPPGSFVFVLSDFLPPPRARTLRSVVAAGWDTIAVIIQDPVWEQSFPEISGVVVPLTDVRTGLPAPVRLTAGEARRRRTANEHRVKTLRSSLKDFDLDSIVLGTSNAGRILSSFRSWAEHRSAWIRRLG